MISGFPCLRRSRALGALVVVTAFVLGATLSSGPAFGQATKKATDETLSLVPKEFAACVVLEDLTGNLERFHISGFGSRTDTRLLLTRFTASKDFLALLAVERIAAGYLDISTDELRKEVFGQCVVLAFKAGRSEQDRDAGILLCRVGKAEVRDKVASALLKATASRKVEVRRHRQVEYHERREGKQTDYLAKIANVLMFTDNEAAIKASIDASLDRISFADSTQVKKLRSTLPEYSVVQLLVQPRSLDHRWKAKAAANPSDTFFGSMMERAWKAISGLACTLNLDEGVAIGLHVSTDEEDLPNTTASSGTPNKSDFWDTLPPDAMLAASVAVDFAFAGSLIGKAASFDKENVTKQVMDFVNQLLVGHDVKRDVLPRIGPEIGLILTSSDSALKPNVVALTRLQDTSPKRPGEVPLSNSLESALKPLLVLMALEDNRDTKGHATTGMAILEGARYHFLSGLKNLPPWLQPGFAVTADYIITATSRGAAEAWLKKSAVSFWATPAGRSITSRIPQGGSLVFYANVSKMREAIEKDKPVVVDRLTGGKKDISNTVSQRLDTFLNVAELFDYCIITVNKSSSIHNITLSLLPSAKPAPKPQQKR